VAIVKETSLASTFFVGELMTQFKTIQGITYRVLEPLTIVGLIYFLVTFVMSKLIALLERRMNASER
jgi:ABC-type amino acid transport system permease subunit